jgi:ParB family chromosome partitioning protein
MINELVKSITQNGLLQPILVDQQRRLIAGRHRLEACKELGMAEIDAVVVPGSDEQKTLLIQLDENLCRSDLNALDKVLAIKKHQTIYENLYPDAVRKGRRKKSEQHAPFTYVIASKNGCSKRVIQKYLKIGKTLSIEAADIIKNTPIAEKLTELARLAKYDLQRQISIAKEIVEKELKTVPTEKKSAPAKKSAVLMADGLTVNQESLLKVLESAPLLTDGSQARVSIVRKGDCLEFVRTG